LPFTSGVVAKIGVKSVTKVLPAPWSDLMAAGLPLVAIGTTLLMARFLYLVWPHASVRPVRPEGLFLPWTALLILVAFSVWTWPAAHDVALRSFSVAESWHALWPIGLGASAAWAVWVLSRKAATRLRVRIPPGDILQLATGFSDWLGRAWSSSADRYRRNAANRQSFWRRTIAGSKVFDTDRRLEARLRRWGIGGIVFLAVLVLVFLTFALG
jgi:hypothetical protein